MASNRFLILLTIVAIFLPAMAFATDYLVGDTSGWTINFDYQAWAKDKVFYVGDKLVFQYPQGNHNVFKVNGTGFSNCEIPPENEALTSGNDTIVLKTPGNKWYICGVSNHCASYGQKLKITVQYPNGWAPAPSPTFSFPWAPAILPVPEPPTPAPTSEPWAPAILPIPPAPTSEPWAPTTPIPAPWAEATPTEPWAPATPPEPWAPIPAPWTPTTPQVPAPTAPWPPAPSPYPWI